MATQLSPRGAAIAHYVTGCAGLASHGQEDDAVRWIAVRHADDHIHLMVMLALPGQ